MMTPLVERALAHLLGELHTQVFFAQPLPMHPDERATLFAAMCAREDHFFAVARESQTPDELLATLIADGTLSRDYAWPAWP